MSEVKPSAEAKFVSPSPPPEGYIRELLTILAEECAEVTQRATKALRPEQAAARWNARAIAAERAQPKALSGKEDLCQCPACGRMHRSLGFGTPPKSIANPSPKDDRWLLAKATPRPWRVAHSDPAEGVDCWWLCAGEGNLEKEIGSVMGGYPQERGEANAALIVAAVNAYEGRDTSDYYESHEALSDLVALWAEYEALNGGGPGWQTRFTAALRRAEELTRKEP